MDKQTAEREAAALRGLSHPRVWRDPEWDDWYVLAEAPAGSGLMGTVAFCASCSAAYEWGHSHYC